MGVAITPVDGFAATGTPGKRRRVKTLRQSCEEVRGQAELERTSFIATWRDLGDYILPTRPRFFLSQSNKGDRRNFKITDTTATLAARTTQSGMMSGVSSPARPWFRLSTPDPALNQNEAVKVWLHDVATLIEDGFRKSNLYNALPIVYGDMAVFGTAAVFMEEDDEHIFRFTTFAVGEYAILLDAKRRVRTLTRVFRWSVDQVVEKWGQIDPTTGLPNFADGRPTTISVAVQNLWLRNNRAAPVDIVHLIQPNRGYDGQKIDSKFKAFEQVYYELGASGSNQITGVLEHSGYDEFPLFCPRWEVSSGDIYGTNCPGMTAIGDIKELQLRTKRVAQAVEKMINPPMVGPAGLKTVAAAILPGHVTYYDMTRDNRFMPAHEVNFAAAIQPMQEGNREIRLRVSRSFFEDLFLMLANSDRREITAREIDERHEEKLLALGPMLEQLNQDLLDPLIDRAFNIMYRKGLIPPAPEELHGMQLRVEYVSIMAQAQKLVGLASLERSAGFLGQVATYDPSVVDIADSDEMIRTYFDATGVSPKVLRTPEDVQRMREQRSQAAAAQRAAENAPGLAGAARDLSQASTKNDGILAQMVGGLRAKQNITATAQPPAPVIQ